MPSSDIPSQSDLAILVGTDGQFLKRVGGIGVAATILASDVSGLAGDLGAITADIDAIDAAIDSLTSSVAGLTTTVSGHTTSIAGLTTTVSGHTTSIAGLTTTVSGHTTSIAGLTTSVSGLTSSVALKAPLLSPIFTGTAAFGMITVPDGTNSERFGAGATATGADATAVGNGATAGFAGSISLGRLSAATAANQLVAGSSTVAASDVYFGKGVADATPTAYTIHGTGGSGANITGGGLNLSGGQGTGTGAGGTLKLQVAPAGLTGSGVNALVDALVISTTGTAVTLKIPANGPNGRAHLYFGGTTNGFPKLLQVGTSLNVYLADESDRTDFNARNIVAFGILQATGSTSGVVINKRGDNSAAWTIYSAGLAGSLQWFSGAGDKMTLTSAGILTLVNALVLPAIADSAIPNGGIAWSTDTPNALKCRTPAGALKTITLS